MVAPTVGVGNGGLQPVELSGAYAAYTQLVAPAREGEVFAAALHEDVRLDDLAVSEPHGRRDVRTRFVCVGCERPTRVAGRVGSVFVPGADCHDVERFCWREQGSLGALFGECLEDGALPLRGGRVLQLGHPAECPYRQRLENIAGADQEQNPVPVGQVIEEPAPRAHELSERSIRISEREIDEEHVRCGGVALDISFLHPHDRAVDRVEQETVGVGPLVGAVAGCVENRADVEPASQCGARQIAIPMQNERGHLGAVAPLRDDAERLEIVGIVKGHAAVEQPVSENGHTVEECCYRRQIGRGSRLDRPAGAERVDSSRKLGRRLRQDEHGVIADRQRRFLPLAQAAGFRRRQIDQGRLIGNLGNRRPVQGLAADSAEGVFQTIRQSAAPFRGRDVPELDLHPNRVPSGFELNREPIGRGLRNAILRPPRPQLAKAVEQPEPWGEVGRRLLAALITIPETHELPERRRVRHGQVQSAANRPVGSVLAFRVLAGVGFGKILAALERRLLVTEVFETFDALCCTVEVVNGARHVQHERTLGCDPRRVLSEGHRIAAVCDHAPQALKDRSETFPLPLPTRQAQVASASLTTRSSIRFRDWNRQQRELRHPACLRLQRPATVPARGSAFR